MSLKKFLADFGTVNDRRPDKLAGVSVNIMGRSSSREVLTALSLVLILMCLRFVLGTVLYEGNDDVAIISMLRGFAGIDATYETVFMSLPLSWVLFAAYKYLPSIPWYPAYLYSILFLSCWAGIYVTLRMVRNLACRLAFLLAFSVLFFEIAGLISFSAVSLVAVFGAVGLFACMLRQAKFSAALLALSAALLASSYALRPSIFILGCGLSLPVAIVLRKELRRHCRPLLFAAVPLLVLILVDVATVVYLRNQGNFGWALGGYNLARARFNDYSGETVNLEALSAAGWSVADYVVAKNWWLYDKNLYSEHNLNNFLALSKQSNSPVEINSILSAIITESIAYKYTLAIVVSAIFTIVLTNIGNKSFVRGRLFSLIIFLVNLLFLAILMWFRFPARVAYPAIFSILLFSIFFIVDSSKEEPVNHGNMRSLLLGLSLVFSAYISISSGVFAKNNIGADGAVSKRVELEGFFEKILSINGQNTIFVDLAPHMSSQIVTAYRPFETHTKYFDFNKLPAGPFINTKAYDNYIVTHFNNCDTNSIDCILFDNKTVCYFYQTPHLRFEEYSQYFLKHLQANYLQKYPGKRIFFTPLLDGRLSFGMNRFGPLFFKVSIV